METFFLLRKIAVWFENDFGMKIKLDNISFCISDTRRPPNVTDIVDKFDSLNLNQGKVRKLLPNLNGFSDIFFKTLVRYIAYSSK